MREGEGMQRPESNCAIIILTLCTGSSDYTQL